MNQKTVTLNEGWRFHYGDAPEAWYKGYDDRAWDEVFLPHDWSVHMPFREEYSSGTGYLAGGIGWYRVHFSLPESARGKRIRIVFDGIYKNSRIWCNSYHLGKRPYGYSEISYDITDFVSFGEEENVISVQVTHTDLADSRWFTGSGIYRKVWLIVEEPVHPALHGICFRTLSLKQEGSGSVEICAEFVNDSGASCSLQAVFHLLDEDNQEAAVWEAPLVLAAGESRELRLEGTVETPHLWSVDSPYLYMLVTELVEASPGCEPDHPLSRESAEEQPAKTWIAQTQRVGIRTIRFDPDEGFFLNERNLKLKGVCVHHDGGCLGAAMYREIWLRRLLKLKEAGCNAIRTSHNPHMPELYDLCDELGFLMMDEAFDEWENPKNKWSTGHNVYPPKHQGYAEDFPQWYREDLTTMIRRDRNHPSIILWSIGNEIDYPNDPYCHPLFQTMVGNNDADKPAAEMRYNSDKPNMERLSVIAARLAGIVRELDGSRPVTLAAAFPELSSRIGFLDALDVVGYNYKEHLYEQDHERFPEKPLLGSENSHSYQAWRAVTEHPYISGQFLWTGIDYLGEAHGWPIHGSGAGILDLAGYEKPEYYRRRAWWSEEPYLCLLTAPANETGAVGETPREWQPVQASWNYNPGELADVYCYTNLERTEAQSRPENPKVSGFIPALCKPAPVELFLNGRSCGMGLWEESYGRFAWRVNYEPGILQAVCRDSQSMEPGNPDDSSQAESLGNALSCSLETAGSAARIEAKVWEAPVCRTSAYGSGSPAAERDCSDSAEQAASDARITQIELSLSDTEGRLAVKKDVTICAEVGAASGEGKAGQTMILGMENGDLADLTPYMEGAGEDMNTALWSGSSCRRRRTYHGRLILYIRSQAGSRAPVKISCEELGQTVTLTV